MERKISKQIDTEAEIDALCDEFENAWVEGDQPEIEEFLRRVDTEHESKLLLQLLKIEIEYRSQSETPSPEEYNLRFLSHHKTVDDAFQEIASRLRDAETLPGRKSSTNRPVDSSFSQFSHGVTFGQYELQEEIASGGMGVVFRARQTNADRIVAIKFIRSGDLAGHEERERFFLEARAAAALRHDNIVQVYDVGELDGNPYFSMEYVEGESLSDQVKNGPVEQREAAEVIEKICRAVEHAHQKNVIHRDIKPGNILRSKSGKPLITDFGLAKTFNTDSDLTTTGQILGTPSYMPPEQASGAPVDHRSDVYSLGATLYCLLTGRPPFQASNPIETLTQLLDKEPALPSSINPELNRDLETICLKCLQKEPQKRYASAAAFADELRRFLDGMPILARPVSLTERTVKWSRKHPLVASLILAVALSVLGGTSTSIAFAILANQKAIEAEKQYNKYKLMAEEERRQRKLLGKERDEVKKQKFFVELQRDESEVLKELAEKQAYASNIQLSFKHWMSGNARKAVSFLKQTNAARQGWAYRFLESLYDRNQRVIQNNFTVTDIAYHPNKDLLAHSDDKGHLVLRKASTGKWLRRIETTPIAGIAYSPDGQHVATGHLDGSCRLWTGEKLEIVSTAESQKSPVVCIEYCQDGKELLVGLRSGRIMRFSASDLKLVGSQSFDSRHGDGLVSATMHSNHQWIATSGLDKTVRIWNADSGELLETFGESSGFGSIGPVCFHPGRNLLAISGTHNNQKSVSFWDPIQKKEVARKFEYGESGNSDSVMDLEFNPEGDSLVVLLQNGKIEFWHLPSSASGLTMIGHSSGRSIRYSPDGEHIASAGDSTFRIWNFQPPTVTTSFIELDKSVSSVWVSPDGNTITAMENERCSCFDLNTKKLRFSFEIESPQQFAKGIGFAPDTNSLVYAINNRVFFRDLDTGETSKTIQLKSRNQGEIRQLLINLELNKIVCSTSKGMMVEWDLALQQWTREIKPVNFDPAGPIAVSRSGEILAYRDVKSKTHIHVLRANGDVFLLVAMWKQPHKLVFSPDEKSLASAASDGELFLWDLKTGRKRFELQDYSDTVNEIMFSSDSSRMYSLTSHGFSVWDSQIGRQVIELPLDSNFNSIAVHPDEERIFVSGNGVNSIRMLDASGDNWYRSRIFVRPTESTRDEYRYRWKLAESVKHWRAAEYYLDRLMIIDPSRKREYDFAKSSIQGQRRIEHDR